MARRYLVWAIALSLGLHGVALLALWLAPAWPWPSGASEIPAELVPWLTPVLPDEEPSVARAAAAATALEYRSAGDSDRIAAAPSAPTRAPDPDPAAGAAARSGGDGRGAPTRVTDRADAVSLNAQPYDASRGYQVQRIRTGDARESREQVRATPHPALTPWLATLEGHGHARHEQSHKQVSISTYVHALMESSAARQPEPLRGRELVRVQPAPPEPPTVTSDPEGQARPWLPRDPAATDTAKPSEDVRDRVDTPLVSDVLAPDKLELTRPAAPGNSESSTGNGALGFAPEAHGTAPVPTGAPGLPRGPLRLATYQRQYDQYVSRVKQKVDPLWEFPRDLALRLEQGDLLVAFTIQRDGRLKDLRLIKRSGFPAFDKNVLSAIKKAAPFDPLPATFGQELRVTAPFAGGSPAIR